ncbi:MAG: ATP:cob(I)alamin adenosyltransferase, partial [Gaiellaceae bacterium]
MSPRRPDEPVRLTRIYTRGGDAGETSRGDGSRTSKLDPLVRAYGAVDELNSVLGWAQVEVKSPWLARIQNELFDVGADLSVPYVPDDGRLRTSQEAID